MGQFKQMAIETQFEIEEALDAAFFYSDRILLTTEFFYVEEPGMTVIFWN